MFPFEMDNESGVPLWIQLRNRIVHLINTGYYKPGDQLPTVHAMASELSINYNTVNKVYVNLANDGYITSIRGRGAFVNDSDVSQEHAQAVEQVLEECIAACMDLGLSLHDIAAAMRQQIRKTEKSQMADKAPSTRS